MDVFVVLALALMVLATALAVITAVQLVGVVRRLLGRVSAAGKRIRPAIADLESELAVASTEVEALERRVQRGFGRQR